MKFCSIIFKSVLPVLFLVGVFAFPPHANAATTQVYSGPVTNLSLYNGNAVWLASVGATTQFSVYNIASASTQVSNTPDFKSLPSIKDGKAVSKCYGSHAPNASICIYDYATDTMAVIDAHAANIYRPHVDGTKVAWGDTTHHLYLYDMNTQVTTQIGTVYPADYSTSEALSFNEGLILYKCINGTCIYNVNTQTNTTLALWGDDPYSVQQINNGRVVFQAYDEVSMRRQIYMYDTTTATVTQITNDAPEKYYPTLYNNKIAWFGFGYTVNSKDVYLHDLVTHTTTNLTNGSINAMGFGQYQKLFIDDSRVVWQLHGSPAFAYDIPSHVTQQITPGTINQASNLFDFTFSGGKAMWMETANLPNYNVKLWDGQFNPVTVTYSPTDDTYLAGGSSNRNYGAGVFMRLQSSGSNRSVVRFNHTAMQNQIGNLPILSAKLRLTITSNGNNWSTGRTIDVHRLTANWLQGNGTEANKGTGSGATWACALDSNINNTQKNCSGVTEWSMSSAPYPWNSTPTDTETIVNNQSGVVEFDVTADILSFMNGTNTDYGWLLKKTNEGQNGTVSFGTKESTAVPQLEITYQP